MALPPYLQSYTGAGNLDPPELLSPPGTAPYIIYGKRYNIDTNAPQNTTTLPYAAFGQRNEVVSNLLRQLQGPSFADLYASGLMDQLASKFMENKRRQTSNLGSRGLLGTGVETAGSRGLLENYGRGVLTATGQGASQEQQRKQSLLNALLGVEQTDIAKIGSLEQSKLAVKGAKSAESLALLQGILTTVGGGVQLAGTLVGGYAGASGGLTGTAAGLGTEGGAGGALVGANLGSQVGGGNYGALAGLYQPYQPYPQYPQYPQSGYPAQPQDYTFGGKYGLQVPYSLLGSSQ